MTALPLLTQCLLTLAALANLCLAMPRHFNQLPFAAHPRHWRRLLRWTSTFLLASAMTIAVVDSGWGPGLVELFGVLTLAAFLVIGVATYRPLWLTLIAVGGLMAGCGGLALIYAS